jgi:hypothetical protein
MLADIPQMTVCFDAFVKGKHRSALSATHFSIEARLKALRWCDALWHSKHMRNQ